MKPWTVPAMPAPVAAPYRSSLAEHPAEARVFRPGRLTFGVIAPLEGYPDTPWPTLEDHAEAVRRADRSDLAAIWPRDVPFFDPGFGDTGQPCRARQEAVAPPLRRGDR